MHYYYMKGSKYYSLIFQHLVKTVQQLLSKYLLTSNTENSVSLAVKCNSFLKVSCIDCQLRTPRGHSPVTENRVFTGLK